MIILFRSHELLDFCLCESRGEMLSLTYETLFMISLIVFETLFGPLDTSSLSTATNWNSWFNSFNIERFIRADAVPCPKMSSKSCSNFSGWETNSSLFNLNRSSKLLKITSLVPTPKFERALSMQAMISCLIRVFSFSFDRTIR
jgi:hypothetical protein